jgi:hypothetical protein
LLFIASVCSFSCANSTGGIVAGYDYGRLLAALAVHLCIYIPVLAHIEAMPAILYVVIMPIETMLIFLVFKLTLNLLPDPNAPL